MAGKNPIDAILDDLDNWSKDKSLPFPESCRVALNRQQNEEEIDYDEIAHEQADPYPDFGDAEELTPAQEAELDAWEGRQETHAHDVFID